MNITARDLQDFCIAQMTAMCQYPERTDSSVYGELSEYSGLSKDYIRKLHLGQKDNPSVAAVDSLVSAIKKAMRKAAA